MTWGNFKHAAAILALATFLVSCAGLPKPPSSNAAAEEARRGTILLHGGDDLGPEFVGRIAAILGPNRELCLITTANDQAGPRNPDPSSLYEQFRQNGVARVRPAYYVTASDAAAPATAQALADCGGYFFDGGLPKLLSDALLVQRDGKVEPTLALAAIIRRFEQDGALLSGSSAGAMIMGPVSECGCQFAASPNALLGHFEEVPGFAVVPAAVDAHAMAFSHYGRDMVAMRHNHWPLLIAIDRSTALEIPPDGSPWRVLDGTAQDSPRGMLGGGSVMILHSFEPAPKGSLGDFEMSLLGHGDLYDPAADRPIPSPARIADSRPHNGQEVRNFIFANDEFEYGLHEIAEGRAKLVGWDPQTATRTRVEWNAGSAEYAGGDAPMLTHLSLAIDRPPSGELPARPLVGYAREDWDWSVAPVSGPVLPYESHTPTAGPGVRTISTDELAERLGKPDRPVLVDSLPIATEGPTPGLAGSLWLPRSGATGKAGDAVEAELGRQLAQITRGDFSRPIVFYDLDSAHGWSYNAAQRARHLGYQTVLWYRGGVHAWEASGRPVDEMK